MTIMCVRFQQAAREGQFPPLFYFSSSDLSNNEIGMSPIIVEQHS